MERQIQKITTKALIKRDGKILFVQDQKGKWELPGGTMRFGENIIETLKREINEELGINITKTDRLIHVWQTTFSYPNATYQFVAIAYACRISSYEIKLSEEHQNYKWCTANEIQNLNTDIGYKEACCIYLKNS